MLSESEALIENAVDKKTDEFYYVHSIENDSSEINCNDPSTSKMRSFFSEIMQLKIELVLFLYMFSYTMKSISSTTMIMDKVCLVHMKHTAEICGDLSNHSGIQTQVEKLSNNYNLGLMLLYLLPSSIISCFVGAWSDKYGRKIPIIVALIGIILDGVGSTVCAVFFHTRVELYVVTAAFTGFSGGIISVITVLYSYASDITTFDKRTMKYAFMGMAYGLATPLGQLAGGLLFRFFGYISVFSVSTGVGLLALVWVLFVVAETRGLDKNDGWRVKLRSLWSTQHVVESYWATVMPRPNRGRNQILLLMMARSLIFVCIVSHYSIGFLFVLDLYHWDNPTYSTVIAFFSVIGTLAVLAVVPVFQRMNLGDSAMGIAGTISMLGNFTGMGLATRSGFYILAQLVGLLSGLATLAARSRISKIVPKDDLGKVFAVVTATETLVSIPATVAAVQIYNATLDVYPGLFYLILSQLLWVPLGVCIWLARLTYVNYEELQDSSVKDIQEDY